MSVLDLEFSKNLPYKDHSPLVAQQILNNLETNDGKDWGAIGVMTNPKWNTYHWFLRGRKVCWETRLRVDPDGYRFIKTPSWGSEMVYVPANGRTRGRLRKVLTMKK